MAQTRIDALTPLLCPLGTILADEVHGIKAKSLAFATNGIRHAVRPLHVRIQPAELRIIFGGQPFKPILAAFYKGALPGADAGDAE